MAFPSTNITFAGDGNKGTQIGHNSGVNIHVAAPDRPETPPQPSCFVPFRRNPDFVARGTLVDQIHERCAVPASRVALVGLGGVGKSQLTIAHCYRTAEQSSETWVFWVHASNPERLEQGFREIAEQVKIRGRNNPQANVFKLVHDWLRNKQNGPWLLVLDNADDASVLSPLRNNSQTLSGDSGADGDTGGGSSGSSSALQQRLSSYLPPSTHGSVLVTSRTKRAATQIVEDSDVILINPMDEAAARELLDRKLGDKVDRGDGIAELAVALEYMPLALVQAAAYIRERAPRCSVQQYLTEYRESDSRKTSLLNQAAGHLHRDEAASNSVLLTCHISIDHIRSIRGSAADLLSLMSFFDRQGIQDALLRRPNSTANNDSFEKDVVTLRDYSFITITRDANTFEMHSLVQLATRTWLEKHSQLDKWREHFIANLCAELPNGQHENWEKCQVLFPHAKAALAQRPKGEESRKKWALLLYNAAWYAQQQGRAGEAEHLSTVSMEVRRELFGEENADTLSSMGMIGVARVQGGKYKEAEAIERLTLAWREKVLGPEHPDTLMSMNNLAVELYSQGNYKEAEAMHRQTLAWSEKVLGPEHPCTLININNLALSLGSQGKYKEAEAMYKQTLAQKKKVLGPEHPSTLSSVYHLAFLLTKQCCYHESLTLYERACAGFHTALGDDHPITRECHQDYAEARVLATEEQRTAVPSPATQDSSTKHMGKASKSARRQAKIRVRSSKTCIK